MSNYVQSGSRVEVFGGTSATASIAGTASGNLLILEVSWQQDGALATPLATPSGWSVAIAPNAVVCKGVSSYRTGAALYYIENASAGTHSAVLAATSGGVINAQIHEFVSGVTSASLDKTASNSAIGSSNSVSGNTGTTATTSQANEIVFALLTGPGLSGVTNIGIVHPATTGYTDLSTQQSQSSSVPSQASYSITSSAGAQTAGWTWTTSGEYAAVIATFKATALVVPPIITGLSSTTVANGSSLTLTGTTFGSTQGAGTVIIGGITQTVTSWSDTSITIGVVSRGTLSYGNTTVAVTNNAGNASNSYTLTLSPQTGWKYVTLVTPNTTTAFRITAIADLAAGDQVAYDTKSNLVIVNTDASFIVDPSVASFGVEAWFTGNGWGSTALQTLAILSLGKLWGFTVSGIVSISGKLKSALKSRSNLPF